MKFNLFWAATAACLLSMSACSKEKPTNDDTTIPSEEVVENQGNATTPEEPKPEKQVADNTTPANKGDKQPEKKAERENKPKDDKKPAPAKPATKVDEDLDEEMNVDDMDMVFDDTPDPQPNDFISVDKEPVWLNEAEVRALIKYPEGAKKDGVKGKVYMKILVGLDGDFKNHFVRRSPDIRLTNAVLEGVRQGRFKPATKDGKPVKYWLAFEYNFQ
jgi:protein TonB